MAYKTFANGFPLPASDLNNYLMNQSVIVFADVAARTAALPTPVEGMITYLESDDQLYKWTGAAWVNINDNSDAIPLSTVTTAGDLIVADGASSVGRLGVGAEGTILSVVSGEPAWVTSSAGALNTIHSGTLSGSSVVVSSIPSTFKRLEVWLWGMNITSASTVTIQARVGATAIPMRISGTFNNSNTQQFSGAITPGNIKAGTTNNSLKLVIDNYSETNNNLAKAVNFVGGMLFFDDYLTTYHAGGATSSATTGAIDGIVVSTGSSFTTGQIRIYGVN